MDNTSQPKFKEMTKEQKKKYCKGCYNDVYNLGLGGAKECWGLETAEMKMRKKVSTSQPPPWNHAPSPFLSCYNQPGYVFFDGDKTKW